MKKLALVALPVAVLAVSSGAFAEGKTRAQVYQELIDAQRDGLDYITDATYPDVNPAFANVVEQHKQAFAAQANAGRVASAGVSGGSSGSSGASGSGGTADGTSDAMSRIDSHPDKAH